MVLVKTRVILAGTKHIEVKFFFGYHTDITSDYWLEAPVRHSRYAIFGKALADSKR